MTQSNLANIEQLPLGTYTEKAYLDYSMYVILDRALPHIADGLKPVQRRIIYAMSELGLKSTAKYKKSARTIGDVLGKYHPHGDSACYEAMVLMAQPFSYRYPFIDGQGNWGSTDDPKSFAAMRYTEARLTAYAQALLAELQQGTVDWQPNFDGTLEEPVLLPARLPNILLNGTSGIAVGMSTDIPPHNLTEITNACIHLLDHPNANYQDIANFVKGPDFPTAAEIISSPEDIGALYEKGNGTIRQRAVYEIESGEIIVTALPYQVSGAKILEQIAAQMLAKKLPNVSDLRDESDHENPVRLVISPRSNRVDTDQLMGHLFATTDLERTYRVNLNMIGINGKPEVKPLVKILSEWITYRKDTVVRRLNHRLQKVIERLHILDGLLIAYLNLDDVIRIIREYDHPKQELMTRYQLSEQQADAILDIKLRQLAKLEEIKIREEQNALSEERKELEAILGSNKKLVALIKKELLEDQRTFGDVRQSPIVQRFEAQAIREEDIIPSEPVTVILSKKGWVRSAKGHEIDASKLNYRSGDECLMQAHGKSNQQVIFIDSNGKAYSLLAHSLPSARGHGEPLTSRLKPENGAHFVAVLMGADHDKLLVASDAGYGFIASLNQLHSKNKAGKNFLKLPTESKVMPPQSIEDASTQNIAAITNEGRLLIFPVSELPELPKGKGNKVIQIPSARSASREEYCIAMVILSQNSSLTIHSGKRHCTLKPKDYQSFIGERGRRGNKLPRGFQKVDFVEVTTP